MLHARLLSGFSRIYGMPTCSQSCSKRIENISKRLPIETFFWSAGLRFGSPHKNSRLRRGPGPFPSFLRAIEKEVQGIPHQINCTRPLRIQLKIRCSTRHCKTSCWGLRQISKGKHCIFSFPSAVHIRAVPANTSSENRCGKV